MRRHRSHTVTQNETSETSHAPNPGFSTEEKLIPSGSTMLNIACSGNPLGAFLPGRYYLLVGDSSSGKTFISTGFCAEVVHSDAFRHYRTVIDDAERGNNLDKAKLFGKRTAAAVEAPSYDSEGQPVYSYYIEDFYDNLNKALDQAEASGRPVFYILDSMDVLTSKAEEEKMQENAAARENGKDEKGSMGDGKAKYNSANLRVATKRLEATGSVLVIICQTRDTIATGPFAKAAGKGRSGGHALRFYATLEMWTSRVETIKVRALGKDRQIGIQVKVQVKKNRVTGQEPAITFPIYYSYGVDDIGSCLAFLVEEGVWSKAGKDTWTTSDGQNLTVEAFDTDPECRKLLTQAVWERWQRILEATSLNREVRYVDAD